MADSQSNDAALLHRFQQTRDQDAFGELVGRHAPLVWGVCRRRLERLEDAEDAFQTTFLILAIKAGTIRRPEALSGWLHRTASRVARRLATQSPRPPVEEQEAAGLDALGEITRREMIAAVDEELEALPRRYREVLVMFHLEGCPRSEVANRLGVSEQTIKALLARGRALLRHRLARRGVSLPLLLPLAVETLPAGTITSAARLGSSFGRTHLTSGDLLTTTLSQGANPMLSLITGKTGLAALVVCVGLAVTWIVRGPAQAAGDWDANLPEVLDTALDVSRGASEPVAAVATAILKPDDEKGKKSESTDPGATPARKNPTQYFALNPNETETQILHKLDQQTRAEFPGVPLAAALQALAARHEMNIMIAEAKIEEAGLSTDAMVDMFLNGITLRSALKLLLEPHELTYALDDEVLVITTEEDAATRLDTRAYFIPESLAPQPTSELTERLKTLILARRGFSEGSEPVIETFDNRILMVAPWQDHMHLREILQLVNMETEATHAADIHF